MSSHYVKLPLHLVNALEEKLLTLLGYQMAQPQTEVDAAGTKQLIEQLQCAHVVKVGP